MDTMNIIYAREPFTGPIQKSLFLAGPTPREDGVLGWRSRALDILRDLGYDGVVLVPEPRDGKWLENYDVQIEWEEEGLHFADVIAFWVPRDREKMPGFTTNIEWGEWKGSGKVVWGSPPEAHNTRYPLYYAKKLGVPIADTLEGTLQLALKLLDDPGK